MEISDALAIREHVASLKLIEGGKGERVAIKATPYVWKDPSTLPTREFVYGRHYVRKFVSGTLAPGGLGKSTQELVEAVAMATGRDLLGVRVREPLRVWYWNGEDPMDELERRVAAILLHFKIGPDDLGGRLFLNSGRDCEICLANETGDGASIAEPVIAELEATLVENKIDVWMFDPFVSVHEVSENDNNRIGRVMKALAMLADRTNTAGDIVHHTRKNTSGGETTVEDGRGAKAFIDRVRSARTLNRMSKEEADQCGVSDQDRQLLFRVDIGKANLFAPARSAVWRRLVSVSLGNGKDGAPDDHVGCVERWDAPSLFDGITPLDTLNVQRAVDKGEYREHPQATAWVGHAVAKALEWDMTDPSVKGRVKALVAAWLRSGVFEAQTRPDQSRQPRTYIKVGKWCPQQ